MESFSEHDFLLRDITLAALIKKGTGTLLHKKRAAHGLVYNLEGEKDYCFSDGTIVHTRAEELLYLPQGSSYRVKLLCAGDCIAINFTLQEETDLAPFSFRPKNYRTVQELFQNASGVWLTKPAGYRLKCKSILYEVLYQTQKAEAAGYVSSFRRGKIADAVQYLSAHFLDGPIRIPELAARAGVSEVYFRRLFTEVYGMSPVRYINSLKITRAKELIVSGLYSLSEISELSGFNDPGYFIAEFKKSTGMTPSAFRAQSG